MRAGERRGWGARRRLAARAAALLLVVAAVVPGVSAQAAPATPAHGAPASSRPPRGVFPLSTANVAPTTGNLVYGGGPVLHSTEIYSVFWGDPNQFPSSYVSAVAGFMRDVAADSGRTDDVYSVLTQYYDTAGAVHYDVTYGGVLFDTNPYPAAGCPVIMGGDTSCLWDAQLADEAAALVGQRGLPVGLRPIYFIFTPPGVESCLDRDNCSWNVYSGYHKFTLAEQTPLVYADMPFPSAYPDPASVATFVLAHEHMEAITDPLLNAWVAPDGNEVIDPCRPGPALADGPAPFTQVFNGHRYDMQEAWSNAASGCAARPQPRTALRVPSTRSTAGSTLAFGASGYAGPYGPPASVAWDFGDGTGASTAAATHAYGTPGTYVATARAPDGLGGTIANSVTISVGPAVGDDFTLTTPATGLDVNPGDSVTLPLAAAPTGTNLPPLTFSVAGLPAGATATFGAGAVTIATVPATPTGVSTVTVTASSADAAHNLLVPLRVGFNDFGLAATPPVLDLGAGSQQAVQLRAIPVAGRFIDPFASGSFTAAGSNGLFVNASAAPSTITVRAAYPLAAGTYAATVTAATALATRDFRIDVEIGSRWSLDTLPAPLVTDINSVLSGVSCPTVDVCVGVGSRTALGGRQVAQAALFSGGAWTLEPVPDLPSVPTVSPQSVACPSAGDCVAVGYMEDARGHATTLAERWAGGSWSTVPAPDVGTGSNHLWSVSCASATFCVAVGDSALPSSRRVAPMAPLIETWDGARWSVATAPALAGATSARLEGVACLRDGTCHAVGQYRAGGSVQPLVMGWDGTTWTAAQLTSPAPFAWLGAVSCTPDPFCMAVGGTDDVNGTAPLAMTFDGLTWTTEAAPDPTGFGGGSALAAVSCAGGACLAGGSGFDVDGNSSAFAERYLDGQWSVSTVPPGAAGNGFNGVACRTPAACEVVGGGTSSSPYALQLKVGTWTPQALDAVDEPAPFQMAGSSCASSTACLAVGGYTDINGDDQALAEWWDGTAWRIAGGLSLPGRLALASCPAANACVAAGTAGVVTWNSSAWQVTGAPTDPLSSLTCYSAQGCLGTAAGRVQRWSGAGWNPEAIPDLPGMTGATYLAVACAGASACSAVGSYVDPSGYTGALAARFDGTAWTATSAHAAAQAPGWNYQLTAVACPTTSFCLATGAQGNFPGAASMINLGTGTPNPQPLDLTWTPAGWAQASDFVRYSIFPDRRAWGVACAADSSCWVIGTAYGSNWVRGWRARLPKLEDEPVPTPPNTPLASISCMAGVCIAPTGGSSVFRRT